jgi:glycerophosphoryl diester phosphodiesterase
LDRAEARLLLMIDRVFAKLLRASPVPAPLPACRIVAHRGVHGNGRPENTLAAFDAALAHGVWGIEFDLRWTRDLVPVVVHDPDLMHVFGLDVVVARTSLEDLQRLCPRVPTLAEVLARYGGKLHLMVEIKDEAVPGPDRSNRILERHFAGLTAVRDFHLLSLSRRTLEQVTFAPAAACVPVARWNLRSLSRAALGRGWGGVAAHYAVMSRSAVERHHRVGQAVGTGYIRSAKLLQREVGRGVDWIFSDHAAEVQRLIRSSPAAGAGDSST